MSKFPFWKPHAEIWRLPVKIPHLEATNFSFKFPSRNTSFQVKISNLKEQIIRLESPSLKVIILY